MKTMFTLTGLLLGIFISLAQLPPNVPTQGLLTWYSFNGNSQDLSGNGNHLTNYNATLTADRFGYPLSAYSFDGATSYLLNNAPGFIMSDISSFTVSIWVYKPTTPVGVFMMHGSTTSGYFIYNIQGTSVAQFGTNKQGSAWFWAQGPLTLNTWENYVGVYHNKVMQLYVNGSYVSTNTFTHAAVSSATLPFYVGRGVGGNYTNGLIDDIGVWNRALTPAEIMDLYNYCPQMITNQPGHSSVSILDDAVFSVQATAGVSYQWQLFDGAMYNDISNGGQFSGATTNSLTVSGVTMSNDGMTFRCRVMNDFCEEISDTVQLMVDCLPLVASDPADQTANTQATVTFEVTASLAGCGFQWQKLNNIVWEDLTDGGQYSGTLTNILTVANLQLANNLDHYRCIVDLAGCIDTSAVATLVVESGVDIPENNQDEMLLIYPNPANEILTLQIPAQMTGSVYRLIDSTAGVVATGTIESPEQQIQVSALQPGIYTLQIEGQRLKNVKVVVR